MRAQEFIHRQLREASNKNSQAVAQLKSALLAHKEKLEDVNSDEVYRIIDQLMTRIAKAHKISGKELHDLWVKQYKKIPDAWILSDAASNVKENFADGRNPQDKGDSARHGIKKGSSISALKKIRSSDTASSRKKQLAHWQINMKQGRKKGE